MQKSRKILNVKGVVLDNEQLENYMEKIATNYSININSDKDTYPIPRMKENFEFIEKTYNLLGEHLKTGIDIYPAGEWLLDNFYIVEESYKRVLKDLQIKKYINLPGVSNGNYKGFARIFVIATDIVKYRDAKIDDEIINIAINGYQKRKSLSMEEIWSLSIFLQIAIIENIRNVCEKIYSAEVQKYKVESILERIIERKDVQNQTFKNKRIDYINSNLYKEVKYPFIEYMSYKLKKYGRRGIPYLNILEEQVQKNGITISDAIKKEHFDIADQKVLMGNAITSIREISRINFLNLFEKINGVEEVLKKDPANVYFKMDYRTKEYYRNAIKELSTKTKMAEIYIANTALKLASKGENKKAHIGYYLIGDGYNTLLKELNVKDGLKFSKEKKAKLYIYSVFLIPILLSLVLSFVLYNNLNSIFISVLGFILFLIPSSEIYVQVLNYVLIKKVKPTVIPKIDLNNGIPEEYRTMCIIPTILNNKEKVLELMEKLEVYYLANKSKNMYFTVLGDCTSSKNVNEPFDEEIIEEGLKQAQRLNKKYEQEGYKIFNFLYRARTWNPKEKCYLGWERKRRINN